jgi:hypothetical protein
MMVGNNNRVILYDVNDVVKTYDYIILEFKEKIGDISNIIQMGTSSNIMISSNQIYQFNINNFIYLGTYSNNSIIGITYSNIIDTNYVNYLYTDGSSIFNCGNNSLIELYNGSSFSSVDDTFYTKYQPKMLILDYDIANKSTFFDSNQNYILPNNLSFSFSQIGNNFSIDTISGQTSWVDYYKDSIKTFGYYSFGLQDSNKILISTTFSNTIFSLTFSSQSITYDYISGLIPTDSNKNSLYNSSTYSNITYSSTYSLYLGKNVLCVCLPNNTFDCSIGDCIKFYTNDFTSLIPSSINDILVINRINVSGSYTYIWCYHTFNNSMIKSIKNIGFTIRNLNRFSNSNINSFIYSFNNHLISNGFSINNDNDNIYIKPIFNNYTAYYNLQSQIGLSSSSTIIESNYTEPLISFQYYPCYNILNLLSGVNSYFTSSTTFNSLISWYGIEGNNLSDSTSDNIYINSNNITNILSLGSNLYYVWNCIFKCMYIDININQVSGSTYNSKMLVIDKYIDNNGNYIILFDKKINSQNGSGLLSIDFIQRNTLGQISLDLQDLSTKQRSNSSNSVYYNGSYTTYTGYNSLPSSKFTTESYYEVFVSDLNIRKYL